MVDRKIARKLKGKVLDSCVVPASTYGLEKLTLSELHQHKLQVCENNWIRRIAGVRRVERRRMKDLLEEVGTSDARRNGRTQELMDSCSRAVGAQRRRFWLKKCRD